MPFIAFLLAISLPVPDPIKIGILIMGCMPGGTTSNIFTYFSKGNLALSVLMTVNSTVFGVVLIPLVLVLYAGALDLQIPRENIIATLVLLLVPVAIGMGLRKLNANAGAVTEFLGSLLAVIFILFLIVSWIPRNWDFLMTTSWATYFGAIALGVFGFAIGYGFATLLKLHPRNARTIALETGIQNGPLAIAIIAFTFSGRRGPIGDGGTGALFAVYRADLDDADFLVPPDQQCRRAESSPMVCCRRPAAGRRGVRQAKPRTTEKKDNGPCL
jgi:BASS family bile acid:Na+ symporter